MHVSFFFLVLIVGISTCMILMSIRVPKNKKVFIIKKVHSTKISSGPEILLSQENPQNLQEATQDIPEILAQVPEETSPNLPKPEKLLTSLTKTASRREIEVLVSVLSRRSAFDTLHQKHT